MKDPWILRAIDHYLDGYSVTPAPAPGHYYKGFNYKPYERRQPTLAEMTSWSKQYPAATVAIMVNYRPDREKTLKAIRAMDLDNDMETPVVVLFKLKEAIGR